MCRINKVIKQITPNIDSTGNAWLRNLPRLAFIRQILINAAEMNLFSDPDKDPITAKLISLQHIFKLRWVLEKRNILTIDTITYRIKPRDAIHIINGQKIQSEFIDCKLNGETSLEYLVSKYIQVKPIGSIDHLRKELNLKKIVPIILTFLNLFRQGIKTLFNPSHFFEKPVTGSQFLHVRGHGGGERGIPPSMIFKIIPSSFE